MVVLIVSWWWWWWWWWWRRWWRWWWLWWGRWRCGKKLPHQRGRDWTQRGCSRQNSQDFPLSVHWTAVVGVANYLFLRWNTQFDEVIKCRCLTLLFHEFMNEICIVILGNRYALLGAICIWTGELPIWARLMLTPPKVLKSQTSQLTWIFQSHFNPLA